MAPINYAEAYGYSSLAAAIIFAIVYFPLLGFFIFKYITARTSVYISLSIFCLTRLVGFIIRAVEIDVESAATNESVLIADQVLFGIGFFGLLYSAYTLVMDRGDLLAIPETHSRNIIDRIAGTRRLFRLILTAGVAIGIAGISSSSTGDSSSSTLRQASVIIFLVLTVVQVYLTVRLILNESAYARHFPPVNNSLGVKHGSFILGAIAVLLLIREIFLTVTINDIQRAANEHFWYPLVVIPEVLAVMLYCAPGLVPPKSELNK
ncbi:hypothetical protein BDZ89DRAFT_1115948 [Hymenopellis radicata]|nr:hypothetical protein BDZ89DRAFT_1115948 [Hymenopellis radicata]